MFTDLTGRTRYKVNLHTHTTRSDGKRSPEEAARIYRDAGYDAIALTDHWKYGPGGECEGLTILSGCEYNLGGGDTTAGTMHIVGVGMTRDPGIIGDGNARCFQEVIDGIHGAGGLAYLAHPAWSLCDPAQILGLRGWDGAEIYNSVSGIEQSDRPDASVWLDLAANRGLRVPLTAADDTHSYTWEACTAAVMVAAKSAAAEDLVAALRAGDFYAATARPLWEDFPPEGREPEVHLVREQGQVRLLCSPARRVVFLSNLSWVPQRCHYAPDPDHPLTEVLYPLCHTGETYLRAVVYDGWGRTAWSGYLTL